MSDLPEILIVEDEPDVAEAYELWLHDSYEVHRASSGNEALSQLEEQDIEVVLLDRMMPQMSGGEVLEEIRTRGLDCRVAMVTAVNPDFDIIEMGFDEYITKPPSRDELRETVDRLLDRATLNADLQEYYALVAKRATLQAELSADELDASEEYTALLERIEIHRASVDEAMGDMASDTDFVGAVREIVDADQDAETTESRHTDVDDFEE